MRSLARILDANRNRAAEALRTLEDIARFALDDADLAASLKSLRHEVAGAIRHLAPVMDEGHLVAARDSEGDVGTVISTASEAERASLAAVAAAAGSRAAEALRVLEECAKTITPRAATALESIRYRVYDLAATITLRVPGARREQWRLCLLLTEALCRRNWREVAERAVAAGIDAIQLREKTLDGGELVERVRWLVQCARPSGVRVIVNDRLDVALAGHADGVHLGQTDLDPRHVRQIAGRNLMIGLSTHSLAEAQDAVAVGVDYIGIGAMFPSLTKTHVPPRGPELLRDIVRAHPSMPHLAIGGIRLSNLSALVVAGCRGVAVSQEICGADEPDVTAKAMLAALSARPTMADATEVRA